jgi:hypothetical protein
LYYTTTAAAVPTAGNLVAGELAINTTDGKLYYKDTAGVVQTLASKDTNSGTFTNISVSGVASFADGTVSLPSITNIGDTNTGIFFPAADTIAFTEGGLESMRITSAGDVGIGTSTPAAKLHVNGENIIVDRNAGDPYYAFYTGGTDSNVSLYGGSTNGFRVFTASTERMRITSTGNLAIGTTSTTGLVTLGRAGGGQYIGALDNSTGYEIGYIQFNSDNMTLNPQGGASGTTGFFRFNTSNVERMRIDSSGNVLVGTTSTSPSSGVGTKIQPTGFVRCVSADSTNSTENWSMYSTGAANYRFYVGWGGTIYATSTTITSLSDERVKENIADIDVGLDAVMALKPRRFDWKAGKGKDIKGDRGFIAQEFETVFPEMIDEWKDPAPEGEEPYKAVNADLIPVLVKAIQELKAEVDSLKQQLGK